MRAVALLRGVNVGGVRFAMRDLAAALETAGCTEVRTVLASGNVVLTGDGDERAIAARVAAVIADRFGFDVAVVVATPTTVGDAVAGYPFERAADRHAYVVFADAPATLRDLLAAAGALEAEERVAPGDGVLYWDAPKGRTLETRFGKQLGRRQQAGTVTTRNLNTLEKILAVG